MKTSKFGKTEIKKYIKELEKQIRRRYKHDGRHRRTVKDLKDLKSFINANATKDGTSDRYPTSEFLSKLHDVRRDLEKRAKYDGKNLSIIKNYVEPLQSKITDRERE